MEDPRARQEREQRLPDPDRTRPRPPAAVRCAERLVHVDVHHVEAGLARLEAAQDGIQIGTIHVGQRTSLVNGRQKLADPGFEQAEGGRIGDHDRGRARSEGLPELLQVHAAVRGGRHVDRAKAGHRRGRGICAVRRIGHEDLAALGVAPGLVIGADHEDARQLALRSGGRLERHGSHATDLGEHRLQLEQQLQRSLGDFIGRFRVQGREARQSGGPLVQLGIELHRARAERVETGVDGVVQL